MNTGPEFLGLKFRVHDFNYFINYYSADNVTIIKCIHVDEDNEWNLRLDNNALSNVHPRFDITYSPKIIFELFGQYTIDTLNPLHIFKFPKKVKTNIHIQFIAKLPYGMSDVKLFILDAVD